MPRPFSNKEFEFSQPDGTLISLRGWGNQHYAVFETLDGYTVVENPVDNFYEYAKLSADKSFLEPTGFRVGIADPATLGIPKHIRISKISAKEMARASFNRMTRTTRWQERIQEEKSAKKMMMASRGIIAAPPKRKTLGDYVGLCILVQFPDVPGTDISQSEVENFCNQKGYTGYGNSGSVNDYYSDVSRGGVNYTNIVTPYYTAKNNRAYYTDPNISQGTRARELILEAIEDLKAKGFDFSSLSADNQGFVYALNVFYAGPIVNHWSEGLWPHSWCLAEPVDVGEGKKIYDYQISNMGSQLTLATFCHENGHMVCDFPDLYDYGYDGFQSAGDGNYCLMAFGGDDEKNPVQPCAYLRYKAGWTDKETLLVAEDTYTARAGTNEFFRIVKGDVNTAVEYYIIEARNQEKRDKSLPCAGLAIWHVDELGDNEHQDMTPQKHFECSLIQADNRFDLERGVNAGDKDDLFNTRNVRSFGNSTKPNSRWWDGTSSGLELRDIGDGPNIPFKFVKNGGEINVINVEEAISQKIPDNNKAGITRSFDIDAPGKAKSVEVSVDITHTYIGDLKVTLKSPKGTSIDLHNRFGAGQDNLKQTYSADTTPKLAKLAGETIKGMWSLKVADLAALDEGTLNRWSLKIVPE
jgi:M6 family metalloprotease-like protein